MKLSELHRLVNLYHQPDQPHRDQDVVIQVKLPYSTVGGLPCVGVKQAWPGFDWDAGKFILTAEQPLTTPDEKFHEQFRELQEKVGWLQYENRDLKSEIKKLKAKQS